MTYYITADAMIRYYMLAEMSGEREVGGYAKYHVDEHNNVIITDLEVVKQRSNVAFFEIDAADNALFLEGLVSRKENPVDWGMLFHTHPEGCDANMSGTDVDQLTTMAKDNGGSIARSMILEQGTMAPMINEAVCMEGRVFMRRSKPITILDTVGADDDLKRIGFFDKPPLGNKKKKQQGKTKTDSYRDYHAYDWYIEDEPESEGYSESELWDAVDSDLDVNQYIGRDVQREGGLFVTVIDAYLWESDVILVLTTGEEVNLNDVDLQPVMGGRKG